MLFLPPPPAVSRRALRALKLSKRFGLPRFAGPFLVMVLLTFTAAPAWATASLRCISGPPVSLEVLGNLTHGLGNRLQSLQASLDAPAQGAGPDLAKHTFTIHDVTQLWLDDDVVRLQLYWEREGDGPFGSSEVTILTEVRPDEEDVFSGRVTLSIFDMVSGEQSERKAESEIVCTVG